MSVLDRFRLDSKVAVVTGASSGLGVAFAKALAEAGADVVLGARRTERLEETGALVTAAGRRYAALTTDVTKPEDCDALIALAIEKFGRVDILVNNAGIMRRGNILDISVDDWNDLFAVNINAMFHLCRAALPHMIAGGGGAIVNTASQWGLHPAPNCIGYNVTKAAVASFSQNLARDYAPHNVRVNAVCPGEIHTPMLEAGAKRSGRTIADLDALVPFGRVGRPDEVAALVAFLASEEAAFMCGSLVEITGAQPVA